MCETSKRKKGDGQAGREGGKTTMNRKATIFFNASVQCLPKTNTGEKCANIIG